MTPWRPGASGRVETVVGGGFNKPAEVQSPDKLFFWGGGDLVDNQKESGMQCDGGAL